MRGPLKFVVRISDLADEMIGLAWPGQDGWGGFDLIETGLRIYDER
tara:strand:+ start:4819 stop:4956 length:138 start_codon:yes stop_codon:yes gene_type:complete